jgi:hypothetical protein
VKDTIWLCQCHVCEQYFVLDKREDGLPDHNNKKGKRCDSLGYSMWLFERRREVVIPEMRFKNIKSGEVIRARSENGHAFHVLTGEFKDVEKADGSIANEEVTVVYPYERFIQEFKPFGKGEKDALLRATSDLRKALQEKINKLSVYEQAFCRD